MIILALMYIFQAITAIITCASIYAAVVKSPVYIMWLVAAVFLFFANMRTIKDLKEEKL